MIAIVDYGVGNLFSLTASLKALGFEARVTARPEELRQAERIILPGVGAFGDARAKLEDTGLVPVLLEEAEKKPFLGICLGMQLLFDRSFEYGEHPGLGLVPGEVADLRADNAYWAQFRGVVSKVSDTVYDGFLKSNGDTDGSKSYGVVTDLLVAYFG